MQPNCTIATARRRAKENPLRGNDKKRPPEKKQGGGKTRSLEELELPQPRVRGRRRGPARRDAEGLPLAVAEHGQVCLPALNLEERVEVAAHGLRLEEPGLGEDDDELLEQLRLDRRLAEALLERLR